MALTHVLLVDDDELLRITLATILQDNGFKVTAVASVTEALKAVSSETFDLLLSDLHMPGPGDGLTIVSAMRHASPRAVTILFSAYPEMDAASQAILLQTDQILIKPMDMSELIKVVKQSVAAGVRCTRSVESIAAILHRTTQKTIQSWLSLVNQEPLLTVIPLTDAVRTVHLPQVFRDLVLRLQSHESLGSKKLVSGAAAQHGKNRYGQQYTAAMLVEESRILQVSIFNSLQQNLATIDFSTLLLGVMTIADEVDSQLSQAMESYSAAAERAVA